MLAKEIHNKYLENHKRFSDTHDFFECVSLAIQDTAKQLDISEEIVCRSIVDANFARLNADLLEGNCEI